MESERKAGYEIREIRAQDNAAVKKIIEDCLHEFGAPQEGSALSDPDLGRFSELYAAPGSRYWVAVNPQGTVIAGCGVGPLPGAPGVCELQKMYCVPEARGTGVAHALIRRSLSYARQFYQKCYLETFSNMTRAQRFYESYGFTRIQEHLGDTGHYSCDCLYVKDLRETDAR